jgi:hypothetical protein
MVDLSKRATLATIKSFVKKNRSQLLISTESRFDGMYDGVIECRDQSFRPITEGPYPENTLGIRGAWFVGGSRNRISPFRKNGFQGYEVYNCCGSFKLAIPYNEGDN